MYSPLVCTCNVHVQLSGDTHACGMDVFVDMYMYMYIYSTCSTVLLLYMYIVHKMNIICTSCLSFPCMYMYMYMYAEHFAFSEATEKVCQS